MLVGNNQSLVNARSSIRTDWVRRSRGADFVPELSESEINGSIPTLQLGTNGGAFTDPRRRGGSTREKCSIMDANRAILAHNDEEGSAAVDGEAVYEKTC